MYVDGFVVPVPKSRINEYTAFSKKAGQLCKEHGALAYVECVADDVKPGKVTSFPQAVKLEEDEVVVFSWITYPSKEVRDRVNNVMMEDPAMKEMGKNMPFDGKRMFMGGFKPMIEM